MKSLEKGWLKEYLDFRKELLGDLTNKSHRKDSHPEHTLYRIIQPTGLMYGQVVGDINFPGHDAWSQKDRVKILLAESLISSSLLFQEKAITNPDQLAQVFLSTLESISNFYNTIFPALATPTKTLFGRKKSPLELAEKMLDKRVEHSGMHDENFWTYFFHNSLLFLDVFIFGQWIHTNADKVVSDFLRYESEELRFSIIKVISSAAHANKEVAYEEKKLFEFFLQTTDLSVEKKKEALQIFEKGIAIEDINIPSENSWILKKFFLELAILTLWSDKKIEPSELDYLHTFSRFLGFTEEDLENSMMAIEGFVLEHWEQLEHFQNKQDYKQVSDHFIQRVARVAEKNKSRLARELKWNEDVLALLRRASSNELTSEENERIRVHLIQLIKTLPTFVIIALPQNFLTLPILLKILPQSLFVEGVA